MSRSLRRRDDRDRQVRRAVAIARVELGQASVPRQSALGAFSPAVKCRDPQLDAQVQEFLRSRGGPE